MLVNICSFYSLSPPTPPPPIFEFKLRPLKTSLNSTWRFLSDTWIVFKWTSTSLWSVRFHSLQYSVPSLQTMKFYSLINSVKRENQMGGHIDSVLFQVPCLNRKVFSYGQYQRWTGKLHWILWWSWFHQYD